jgi:putative DNA primase/helicase
VMTPVLNLTSHPNLLCQSFNDYGNAQRLIQMYGTDLLYCPAMRKFLIWDGRRFAVDEKDAIRKLTQEVMLEFTRQALQKCNDETAKFARGCLNTQRLSSAIREAQPLLAVSLDELDTDPHLLNFLNGTLDLRSFQLLPHNQKHLITKVVRYNYASQATCPTFLTFLARILGPLVAFIQKALGYSLTGLTSEKVVFICHGPTNSGKTTLLELIRSIFEEYSTLILVDSLMTREQEDNNSRADLADLRGVRFAMTSETEEGQRLREGKIKRLTQGQGRIKAVRKYENPITFPETHKLWMDTNHKPFIHGSDDSIWNRLVPMPFERLTDSEIDRDLPPKLREEAEGVISWIVEGTRRWQSEGLGRVPSIEAARGSWREEMDRIGAFRLARCIEKPNVSITARPLYQAYRSWCEEAGERPMTETSFGLRFSDRGFEKGKDATGRIVYHGIGLLSDWDAAQK